MGVLFSVVHLSVTFGVVVLTLTVCGVVYVPPFGTTEGRATTSVYVADVTSLGGMPVFQARAFNVMTVTAGIEWPDGSRSPVGSRTSQALPGAHGEVVAFPIDTTPLRQAATCFIWLMPGAPAGKRSSDGYHSTWSAERPGSGLAVARAAA